MGLSRSTLAFALLAWVAACSGGASTSLPGARALEGRLVAPCCFNGTLDIHESPLAHDLRTEIESRITAGESAEAIESDFITRFGAEVVAAKTDKPLAALGGLAALVSLFAGGALLAAARRWSRRVASAPARAGAAPFGLPAGDEVDLDKRLDDELRELD